MKFPLTEQLLDEARRFELRSACCHCAFWVAVLSLTELPLDTTIPLDPFCRAVQD